MKTAKIGILGAGIMGCCLALELAKIGFYIDLFELASMPMSGASLNNEGKLHLGFVYANDPSNQTHKLMVRGSLSFARIIEKLTGQSIKDLFPSEPFHYFIPIDSQLDMKAILNHFNNVQLTIEETIKATGDRYLNFNRNCYFNVNPPHIHEKFFSPKYTLGSFFTEECSVSTSALAKILTKAVINKPNINFYGNSMVISATRLGFNEVEIAVSNGGNVRKIKYPCVVNCLWDDKLRIDMTAGIINTGPWIMRYKAMLSINAPFVDTTRIPSATGILGPYGDVVNHKDGTYYLSWYPMCKLGQTLNSDGRKLHDMIHKFPARSVKKLLSVYPEISEKLSNLSHKRFIKNNIQHIARYIPNVADLLKSGAKCKISGGVILAKGNTDIDDPESYLHQRSNVGPVAYGGYITIDTGKYCTAPLFASETAEIISEILS